jgi:hypothetical protein
MSVLIHPATGILIFVGVAGFFECQLWNRAFLLLTSASNFPAKADGYSTAYSIQYSIQHTAYSIQYSIQHIAYSIQYTPYSYSILYRSTPGYYNLPAGRIHLFTLTQFAALGFAWLLNGLAMSNADLSPLGLCFPLIIMGLVPFRMYVMPSIFTIHTLLVHHSHTTHDRYVMPSIFTIQYSIKYSIHHTVQHTAYSIQHIAYSIQYTPYSYSILYRYVMPSIFTEDELHLLDNSVEDMDAGGGEQEHPEVRRVPTNQMGY